jgi:hypothetical protein
MIELKAEHLEKLEEILGNTPKQIPVVTARAMNRAIQAARTQASRTTRETYYIKHKDVISTIKIKKANRSDLLAEFMSSDTNIPLMKFKVNPRKPQPGRKRPVTVSVKKGSKKVIKNGFVAQLRKPKHESGKLNVFVRTTKSRFPLKGLYGPSIPQMIGNEDVIPRVEERAMEVLDTRLEHEISRLLGGRT